MKLDLKRASVIALPLSLALFAISMKAQTNQTSSANTNQSAQAAPPTAGSPQSSQPGDPSPRTESLAERARKAKAANQRTPNTKKPKVFNQDNFAAATGKKRYSKHAKPKRSGLRKTS